MSVTDTAIWRRAGAHDGGALDECLYCHEPVRVDIFFDYMWAVMTFGHAPPTVRFDMYGRAYHVACKDDDNRRSLS